MPLAQNYCAIADVLTANRAHYEEIGIFNSGNTKIDASIDIDGGIGTLKYYARLGAPLGEAKTLTDGKAVRLTRLKDYQLLTVLHHAAAWRCTLTLSISRDGDVGKSSLFTAGRHARACETRVCNLLAEPRDGARCGLADISCRRAR